MDDVMKYAKQLEAMAAEEKDDERSTAMAAGMAALLYMRGKDGNRKTSRARSEHDEQSKEGFGGMGTPAEARSEVGLRSNVAHPVRGKIRLLEEDEKMIADKLKAVLTEEKICWADLKGMEQINCELVAALLYGQDLFATKNIPFIPLSCPSEGEFVAWKKGEVDGEEVLIRLTIPAEAKRTSSVTRMARSDRAWCDEITSLDGKTKYNKCSSARDERFIYEVGEMAYSEGFCFNRRTDYAPGIHFFIDKEEALRY